MRKSLSHVTYGLVTVFVAIFMLFYIFDALSNLSEQCKKVEKPAICGQLNSFSMSMLTILLIIGGFVITICATAYILLSS